MQLQWFYTITNTPNRISPSSSSPGNQRFKYINAAWEAFQLLQLEQTATA